MTTIIRGSAHDRLAYDWACNEQGYTGTWDQWRALPLTERTEYEVGAAGGDEAMDVCEGEERANRAETITIAHAAALGMQHLLR